MERLNYGVKKFGDDLKNELNRGDKCNIVSAVFSMYAYCELKQQLSKLEEFNFIFTNPTFIKEQKKQKQERLFELNSYSREKSIAGSEFEIQLKNKLNGKAIAKECANWIKKKAKFKSNITDNTIEPFMTVNDKITYLNTNQFSSVGLGYQKDNAIINTVQKWMIIDLQRCI